MLQSTQRAFSAYSLAQDGETWGGPTSKWRNTGAKTVECRKGLATANVLFVVADHDGP